MPLSNGNPTAAELDRACVGERAYSAALADGKGEAEALEIAKVAMREHARVQLFRQLGVEL